MLCIKNTRENRCEYQLQLGGKESLEAPCSEGLALSMSISLSGEGVLPLGSCF